MDDFQAVIPVLKPITLKYTPVQIVLDDVKLTSINDTFVSEKLFEEGFK